MLLRFFRWPLMLHVALSSTVVNIDSVDAIFVADGVVTLTGCPMYGPVGTMCGPTCDTACVEDADITGATGPQGITVATGTDGAAGPTGATGTDGSFVRLDAAVTPQCDDSNQIASWEQCKEAANELGLTWESGESLAASDHSHVPSGCSFWPAQGTSGLQGTELLFNVGGSNDGNYDPLCIYQLGEPKLSTGSESSGKVKTSAPTKPEDTTETLRDDTTSEPATVEIDTESTIEDSLSTEIAERAITGNFQQDCVDNNAYANREYGWSCGQIGENGWCDRPGRPKACPDTCGVCTGDCDDANLYATDEWGWTCAEIADGRCGRPGRSKACPASCGVCTDRVRRLDSETDCSKYGVVGTMMCGPTCNGACVADPAASPHTKNESDIEL